MEAQEKRVHCKCKRVGAHLTVLLGVLTIDSRDFGVDGALDLATDRRDRGVLVVTTASGDSSSAVARMMALVVRVDLREERLGVVTKLVSADSLGFGCSLNATERLAVPTSTVQAKSINISADPRRCLGKNATGCLSTLTFGATIGRLQAATRAHCLL